MVFLDTSFVISYLNKRDKNHIKSREVMNKIISGNYGNLCISDYVFSECASVLFRLSRNIKKTEILCNRLKEDLIFYTDKETFEETFKIFVKQKGTSFSFVDCSIITLMRINNIKYLATFDKDFDKIDEIKVLN
ncbi:type II toxin-antitoxin system VapC family toxin [Candidatus Pacearchaeota archaeon]|nr:type II toxin-antitoxin system VapC family toxin [Candidatus Pacearchaeota archaeon]